MVDFNVEICFNINVSLTAFYIISTKHMIKNSYLFIGYYVNKILWGLCI